MVAVTWATSEVYRRIYNWRVAEGVQTLSDHLYILMEVALEITSAARSEPFPPPATKVASQREGQGDAV